MLYERASLAQVSEVRKPSYFVGAPEAKRHRWIRAVGLPPTSSCCDALTSEAIQQL